MKTTYKAGEKVTISRPGKFESLEGTVVSNNEMADKPLTIDLSPYGIWSFGYADIKQKAYDPALLIKAVAIAKTIDNAVTETLATLNKPKRSYKKRGTPKEVKTKRKYNRKPKNT